MAEADPLEVLSNGAHQFLQPSPALHQSLLRLATTYLDPLASEVSASQQKRLAAEREGRKRKRSDDDDTLSAKDVLRIKRLHVDGFSVDQVWHQAQKVLDAATYEIERSVEDVLDRAGDEEPDDDAKPPSRSVRFDDEIGSDEEDLGEEGIDYEVEGEDDDDLSGSEALDDDEELDEEEDSERDVMSQTSLSDDGDKDKQEEAEELVKDKFGLNDGFFSIDQFNKQSEFLERQDGRGDPNDGAASDEEEVDWSIDPLGAGASSGLNGAAKPSKKQGRKDDSDDEDGPTFGDVDLNAPDSDEDEDEDAAGIMEMQNDFSNTNDVLYSDFFAPPARARGKTERRQRNKPTHKEKDFIPLDQGEERDEEEEEIERAMADVQRDMEDEEEEDDLDLDSGSEDQDMPDLRRDTNLSTHEKRMLSFKDEIRKLEKENLTKREWALQGETVAPARPENALLEEDLDFERGGKPVPIATEAINESIEELIKRRILDNEFDDLTRRRPELSGLDGGARGLQKQELSDAKPTRGLAEEYEDDYLRKKDPNYVDKQDEATKKAHAVIAAQWADLSAQLDALSNYYYKPRPPEQNVDVRTNAPVIRMEEARPTGGMDGGMSGLAPQEVYKPGQDGRTAGEIRTTGGTAIAKEEDTREGKKRRRRRDKARAKKNQGQQGASAGPATTNGTTNGNVKAPKKDSKKDLVKNLKRGNVKVIGKKGELQDVDGKAAGMDSKSRSSGADFML